MSSIPYGKQHITDDDIASVVEVLKSDFLTQGPKVKEFEEEFANYIGVKYAVAVSNGTAALHLSALALNVTTNTNVITTPITFVASGNCIKFCGGNIHFADINPSNYIIDIDKIEALLKKHPKGTFSGIIPVDFAGYPTNMEQVFQLAKEHNLWIIEDACHAPGGYFIDSKGAKQNCGNGNYSDLSIFSFHPVKHIATGEGGMITTNNKKLYEKLLLLRTHGITKNPDDLEEIDGGWYYEMQELGFNYRLSDINAALGISQLKRANENLKLRNEIALKYNNAFKDLDIKTPIVNTNFYHAFHLYVIQIENRLELYNKLREHNIFTQVHYIPMHLQPYYKQLGAKTGDFPIAEDYYSKCLSLPMYPSLNNNEIEKVIDIVSKHI